MPETSIPKTAFGTDDSERLQMALYEYWQLRQEIRDRLQSIRTIVVGCYAAIGGAVAGAIAIFARGTPSLDILAFVFLVPFLAIIPAFSFIASEELSVAVLARYLRLNVELPFFTTGIARRQSGDKCVHLPCGWETYLFIMRDLNNKLDVVSPGEQPFAALVLSKVGDTGRLLVKPVRVAYEWCRRATTGDDQPSILPGDSVTVEVKQTVTDGDAAKNGDVHAYLRSLKTEEQQEPIRSANRRDRYQRRASRRFFRLSALACLMASLVAGGIGVLSTLLTPGQLEMLLKKSAVGDSSAIWGLSWGIIWVIACCACVVSYLHIVREMNNSKKDITFVDIDSLPPEVCKPYTDFFQR